MPTPIAPQHLPTPNAKVPHHACPRCRVATLGASTTCANCGLDSSGPWPAYDKMCSPGTTVELDRAEYHRARICVAACDGVPADVMVVPGFVQRNERAHAETIMRQEAEIKVLLSVLQCARLYITGEALPTKSECLTLINAVLPK
jgi:hypothetical protein